MAKRRLSAEGKILLTNIIPEIEALRPGKSILINDVSPDRLVQIRRHIYTWLEETERKLYYKTTMETSTSLRIICKDLTPIAVSSIVAPANRVSDFVINELLECTTSEEAEELARFALERGELSDDEFIAVLEEWEQKCNTPLVAPPIIPEESEGLSSINPFNGIVEKEASDD